MGFDLSAADAILKDLYLGPIREQLNMATPLLAEVSRTSKGVVGKRVYIPLHVGRSEAVGARADGGSLPTADSQSYKEITSKVKYQYGRIEITLPTIEATKSDEGSFLRAVDAESKGILAELKEDFDRQVASNDENGRGKLAEAEAETTQTTLDLQNVVDNNYGRKLRTGQVVDLIDASDNTTKLGDSRTISSVANINLDTMTATISGAAVTTEAGDYFVREDSLDLEMVGLAGIVTDTGAALWGVDPDTAGNEYWRSTVKANSGTKRALSEDLMQQVIDDVNSNAGEEPDAIVCDFVQRRKFYNLMSSMKRAVNTQELKGGFTALTFNDSIPLIVDRFVPSERMYFINRKHIALYEMSDWDFADNDGAVLSRVSGKPAFEAFLYKFAELGTDKRNSHGVLKDLSNT